MTVKDIMKFSSVDEHSLEVSKTDDDMLIKEFEESVGF